MEDGVGVGGRDGEREEGSIDEKRAEGGGSIDGDARSLVPIRPRSRCERRSLGSDRVASRRHRAGLRRALAGSRSAFEALLAGFGG
jgi:hypothetical protein